MDAVTPEMVTVEDEDWFVATLEPAALGVVLASADHVRIEAERTEQITDESSAAHLMNRCLAVLPGALPNALGAILEDMQGIRAEDWAAEVYGDELDELLPAIDSVGQLLPLLSEPQLSCHAAPEGSDALGLGFGFVATWDTEHGTAAVVRVDAPGTTDQAVEVYEVGGAMASFSPFE